MEYRSIFLANPAQLSVRNQQLVIRQGQEVSIPMEDISGLLIESQQVTITSAAMQNLTEYGVTVYFCDEKHLPAALVLPMNRHSRQLKQIQSQIALSLPAKKRMWQSIVQQKIRNQALCLEFLECPRAVELRSIADDVRSGDPDNYEAIAAARYFPALFGTGFSRGEECVTNAALNYGYAILRGAIARNLVMHGLEPCLGIFHHSELNQFNLADDLIEPFRPLVDLFVATHIDPEETELRPAIKQNLFDLTNFLVSQNQKQYRSITAIGRSVESIVRVMQKRDKELELPTLIPLKKYRYE